MALSRTAEVYHGGIPHDTTLETTQGTVRAITESVLRPTFPDEINQITGAEALPRVMRDDKGKRMLDDDGRVRVIRGELIRCQQPIRVVDETSTGVMVFVKESATPPSVGSRIISTLKSVVNF